MAFLNIAFIAPLENVNIQQVCKVKSKITNDQNILSNFLIFHKLHNLFLFQLLIIDVIFIAFIYGQ